MEKGPKKIVSIMMPVKLYEELAVQARKSSRPVSSYIRQVLRFHLRYLEQLSNL